MNKIDVDMRNFNICSRFMKDTFNIDVNISFNNHSIMIYDIHIPKETNLDLKSCLVIINNLYNCLVRKEINNEHKR